MTPIFDEPTTRSLSIAKKCLLNIDYMTVFGPKPLVVGLGQSSKYFDGWFLLFILYLEVKMTMTFNEIEEFVIFFTFWSIHYILFKKTKKIEKEIERRMKRK